MYHNKKTCPYCNIDLPLEEKNKRELWSIHINDNAGVDYTGIKELLVSGNSLKFMKIGEIEKINLDLIELLKNKKVIKIEFSAIENEFDNLLKIIIE